jgi:Putative polyhydroxyalkanoic acid system protein (PHA_gran_rgn)
VDCRTLRRVKHIVQHPLTKIDAKRAVEAAWASYSQRLTKYDPRLQWLSEDQARVDFKIRGMSFQGRFRIADRSLELELDVPLLLRPFVKPATLAIDHEVAKWVKHIQSQH